MRSRLDSQFQQFLAPRRALPGYLLRARRRRAFSLIELIVVMSVAMLLTAITMPAMRQVHENAQRVACMSNLQQLGHGFIMFGGDNNDNLPTSLAQVHTETPQNLMMSRRGAGLNPGWDGIGLLYSKHYCPTADCFYCPSHHGSHSLDRYAVEWDNPSKAATPIFTNYHYAGHMDWKFGARRRDLLDGYSLVLATDGLRTTSDFNHVVGMNVLRGDGSVRWRDDTDNIYGMLPKSETEQVSPLYVNLWDLVGGPLR